MNIGSRLTGPRGWTGFHAVAAFLIFCLFMLCPAAPEHWAAMYGFFGRVLIVAFIALFFYHYRPRGRFEVNLVILYALWLMATRYLNGDHWMAREPDLILSKFLCAAMLGLGPSLNREGRRRFLNFFCAAVGIFYFASGALAIVVDLLDTYVYLPPENVLFGLDEPWYLHYINVFNTNRTISSLWFYIAFCMMLYQFFACRNKRWRIPIVIAGLLFYVAIALIFSRTVKLICSVSVAMLAMLLAMKYLPLKKLWQKAAVLVLCAALFLPLTFKSFDWTASLMSDVSGLLISETAEDNAVTEGVDFSDNRDLGKDISNLSERKQIFASFLPTLKLAPRRIFVGCFSDKLMSIPNLFVDFPVPFRHMHNFLLETFMLTGLLGFLLVVFFCLRLLLRMLHLFFTSDRRVTLADKVLTIPLAGILLYGMFEVVLFTACSDQRAPTDMRELSFFLIAGMVLGCSRELLPKLRDLKK